MFMIDFDYASELLIKFIVYFLVQPEFVFCRQALIFFYLSDLTNLKVIILCLGVCLGI